VNAPERGTPTAAEEDAELVARVLAGDQRAARALFDRHAAEVARLARRLAGADRYLAEEAAQEAFIRAFRGLRGFRREASFATWLRRIVVTTVADVRRRTSRADRRTRPLTEEMDVAAPPADRAEPILQKRIAAAIDELPDHLRAVFVLHDAEGYTHAEIAASLRAPAGTVRRWLVEARARLRDRLRDLREG
jgi:RNA polymerase sigma-70 factor (ECF subfamily)